MTLFFIFNSQVRFLKEDLPVGGKTSSDREAGDGAEGSAASNETPEKIVSQAGDAMGHGEGSDPASEIGIGFSENKTVFPVFGRFLKKSAFQPISIQS